jgi:hypothetical protein
MCANTSLIPTLALGAFSCGSRVSGIAYVTWWRLGPVQEKPGMDFLTGAGRYRCRYGIGFAQLGWVGPGGCLTARCKRHTMSAHAGTGTEK